jgi:hypothetical protein
MSLFGRIKSGASSLFGGINRGATTFGNLANRAGGILGTISNIASSPIAQTIASSLGQGENLAKLASATQAGQNLVQKVGGISQKVADISSPSTYFNQPAIPAVRNAVERAKSIFSDVSNLVRPMGANPATYSPYNSSGVRVVPTAQPIGSGLLNRQMPQAPY